MARRATAVVVAFLLTLALAACGDGDDSPEDAVRVEPAVEDARQPIRTEERRLAGLRTVVVRPRDHGPWPLVVWVHGAGAPPEFYEDLLEDLAAAGNVVVAPAMPGTVDDTSMAALVVLAFQPGRVRQLIGAVTTGPQAIAAADPERIVVAGHSLGAMTALAEGFHSCCADRRIDAVVSVAGRLATFPGGTWNTGTIPVLLIHGDDDDTVPAAGSGEALQVVGTSAYLLTVEGGDHGGYLSAEDDAYPAVRDAFFAFLLATVGDSPQGGLADLSTAGGQDGVRLMSRG